MTYFFTEYFMTVMCWQSDQVKSPSSFSRAMGLTQVNTPNMLKHKHLIINSTVNYLSPINIYSYYFLWITFYTNVTVTCSQSVA